MVNDVISTILDILANVIVEHVTGVRVQILEVNDGINPEKKCIL
jgi:hypothetical protein